jgi:hypothetical protein
VVGVGLTRFVLYSAGAALLWAGAWMGIGYAVGDALEHAALHASNAGTVLGAALGAVIVVFVGVKWIQRRRFLKRLAGARISPDELKRRMEAGDGLVIVDLRTAIDADAEPWLIPGAVRISAEALEQRQVELPRGAEVVLYCS